MNAPRVDPRTGAIQWPNQRSGVPLGPMPLRGRPRFFRASLGNIPSPSGASGPLIDPYSEQGIYNPMSMTGGSADPAAAISLSTSPTADPATTGYLPMSSPFGESDRKWTNPTTFSGVPINAQTNSSVPTLMQNFQRNALIIQNLSTATSPDTAPTLYVGFNSEPQVGGSFGLFPLVGVVFDIICPRDAIYIAFGPFSNGGGTVVIAGAVVAGTYAP